MQQLHRDFIKLGNVGYFINYNILDGILLQHKLGPILFLNPWGQIYHIRWSKINKRIRIKTLQTDSIAGKLVVRKQPETP